MDNCVRMSSTKGVGVCFGFRITVFGSLDWLNMELM